MPLLRRWSRACTGIVFCIFLNSCVSALPDGKNTADAAEVRQNGKEQKDRLFIFTGSDWSHDSGYFSQNVITGTFKTDIEKKYNVRYIDLLRNPSEAERSTVQKNYLLFSEYAVPDVPFIVLQTPEEDIYAADTVPPEIKTDIELRQIIDRLSARRTAVTEARALIRHTEGVEKAKAIDSFLNTVYNADSRRYDSLRTQVPELDPQNISGLKSKYLLISADIRAKTFAYQKDFIRAGDEYKAAAETGELAPEQLQLAWYLTAYSYLMAGSNNQTVIGYLQKAVAAAPRSKNVEQLNQAIKKLQQTSY